MILGYTLTTFPKVAQYIFMHNPRRNKDLGTIARKGTLHNWWRISGHQVFYPAKGKLNKDKEQEIHNLQNTRKRTTLSFV